MVNGDDSAREFIVYRDSAHAHAHEQPHKRAHSKHSTQGSSSSMTSMSMSARSSAVALGSPQKHFCEMSRLRKLVSLGYYSYKVKGWFHREERDTIVCEDDDEETAFHGDELLAANPKSVASAFYASWMEANASAAKVEAAAPLSSVTVTPCAPCTPLERPGEYEPSKEQRWCTNCTKCFQRSLSRYDQFCGLDCRTAHRFRLAA